MFSEVGAMVYACKDGKMYSVCRGPLSFAAEDIFFQVETSHT